MSMTTRPFLSGARPRRAAVALVVMLGLIITACGGGDGDGGGNGNGDSGFVLHTAIINETPSSIEVSLDTVSVTGELTTIESCDGLVLDLDIPFEDWLFVVNGQTAIDSLEYPEWYDRDLVAEIAVSEDGSVEVVRIEPGRQIATPAKIAICT